MKYNRVTLTTLKALVRRGIHANASLLMAGELGLLSTCTSRLTSLEWILLQLQLFNTTLLSSVFSGNFGFGIQEHIDLGIKYDPSIGIYGMDFYVVMSRPGFNVAERKHSCGRIGAPHRINKDETMKWFQAKVLHIIILYMDLISPDKTSSKHTKSFCLHWNWNHYLCSCSNSPAASAIRDH